MTADPRSDRDLSAILEDLYLGPSPDYRHEVLATATRTRQRPFWTFPGRWLPMADITGNRRLLAPRAPWRAIGAALVIVALIVAALVVVGGARKASVPLPSPFGLAGNGRIAFGFGGDIYSVDPATRASTAITRGDPSDRSPVFSPDGSQIAFLRASSTGDEIVVADPSGAGERVITRSPIPGGPRGLAWAPDSRSLLATAPDGSALWLFDATTAAAPQVVPTQASPYLEPFRPPDGKQILASRADSSGRRQLVVLDLATGAETVLATGGGAYDYLGARWSPDGAKVVFNDTPPGDGSQRLFEIRADGTGLRQLTDEPGTWLNFDPVWSPDGSRIAFARFEDVGGSWIVRPVGIYEVASGSVREVGPLPSDVRASNPAAGDAFVDAAETFQLAWSPDGTKLLALGTAASSHPLLIDVADGTWTVIGDEADANGTAQAWQRTAP